MSIIDDVLILPTLQYVKSTMTHQIYKCPFCNEQKGHFYVDKKLYLYICFKCNSSGHVKSLNMQYNVLPSFDESYNKSYNVNIIDKLQRRKKFAYKDCSNAYFYLMKRLYQMGIQNIVDFQHIRFQPFQMFDKRYCWFKAENAFIGRLIDDELQVYMPKYRTVKTDDKIAYYHLTEIDKTNTNYDNRIAIVEGIFDAINVYYQLSIHNVIAVFNKALTKRIIKLKMYKVINQDSHLLIFLDNDNLNEIANLKALDQTIDIYTTIQYDDVGSIPSKNFLRKVTI